MTDEKQLKDDLWRISKRFQGLKEEIKILLSPEIISNLPDAPQDFASAFKFDDEADDMYLEIFNRWMVYRKLTAVIYFFGGDPDEIQTLMDTAQKMQPEKLYGKDAFAANVAVIRQALIDKFGENPKPVMSFVKAERLAAVFDSSYKGALNVEKWIDEYAPRRG